VFNFVAVTHTTSSSFCSSIYSSNYGRPVSLLCPRYRKYYSNYYPIIVITSSASEVRTLWRYTNLFIIYYYYVCLLSVCLSVCSRISKTACTNFKISVCASSDCGGSVVLWRRCECSSNSVGSHDNAEADS